MEWKKKIVIMSILMLLYILKLDAYACFMDYQVKNLKAEGGVSLSLSGDEGIQNMNQNGYLSGKPRTGFYKKGTMANLTAEVKQGYLFDGWYDGNVRISASPHTDILMEQYKELEARTKKAVFSVLYYANDKTDIQTEEQAVFGETYVIKENTFARTGYVFTGWNEKEDGTGVDWALNTGKPLIWNSEKNLTLYAQWKPITYCVRYHPNAPDAMGLMEESKYTYDKREYLEANMFLRIGYTFCGWNTAPNGMGASYGDASYIENLCSEDGGEIVLYAQWRANLYRVFYEKNAYDAVGDMPVSIYDYGSGEKLALNRYSRPGYAFLQWNTKADGSGTSYLDGQNIVGLTNINGGVVYLYAQWKKEN